MQRCLRGMDLGRFDSNLQNGEKGEEISKTLYDLGFTQLYLATGYQPEKFGQLPWIKQVVGKAPPWQAS